MPIFEYKCSACNNKFEYLHKSSTIQEEVLCPVCNSNKNRKLFSSFSASMKSEANSSSGECGTGNCGLSANSCASGMCGLN